MSFFVLFFILNDQHTCTRTRTRVHAYKQTDTQKYASGHANLLCIVPIFMHGFMYACVRVCVYVCVCVRTYVCICRLCVLMLLCINVLMYVCTCIYVYYIV